MNKNILKRITIIFLIAIFLFPFKNVFAIDERTITVNDSVKELKLKHERKATEGCCFVGDDLIAVCDINVSTGGGDDNGRVYLYNRQTGSRYEDSYIERVNNHSNSMTYDPLTKKILIATKGVDAYEVDLDNHKIIDNKTHIDIKRTWNRI